MLFTIAFAVALRQQPSCCSPGMAQFASDPAFIAGHAPPLPFTFQERLGKTITFSTSDGKKSQGFFVPAKAGNGTALIVIHEWWGLNDYIKREAERLHDDLGSAVLAIDLYEGQVATTAEEATKLMQGVSNARGTAVVEGAIKALKKGELARARAIGSIGWCFGGGWSFNTAVVGGADVKASVIYYGMPSNDAATLAKLRAPILMIWGKKDNFINAKVVSDFTAAMRRARKPLETVAYDAVHAFANPSNPKFDKTASADAYKRTLAFFRKHLR